MLQQNSIPQIGKFSSRKNFRPSHSTTKITPTKYFLRRINGISLYCCVVIATKIKPGENLTDEIFAAKKFPIYGNQLVSYTAVKTNFVTGQHYKQQKQVFHTGQCTMNKFNPRLFIQFHAQAVGQCLPSTQTRNSHCS